MFRCRLLILALIAFALLHGGAVHAIETIKPPLGLSWRESAPTIEKLLKNAKAKIVVKRPVDGGLEAWEVEGVVLTGLKRTIFYFKKNASGTQELVEVELQYQREDWDQRRYDEFMGQVRSAIQRKFGEGAQIVGKDMPEGNIVQRLVGYKWAQNNAAIELYYYSAQNAQNVLKMISVHYKTR